MKNEFSGNRFFSIALRWGGKVWVWMMFCSCWMPHAQELKNTAASEYAVKAVCLFNFVQFVEWPPSAFTNKNTPIVIGVLGKDPFGNLLDQTVQGESVAGRPLVIKRFRNLSDLQACHLLFVSGSEKEKLPQILKRLSDTSTLTVSDADLFLEAGGVIHFVMAGNKVRFEINTQAARRAHLEISSKMLRVAKVIRDS